MKSRTVFAGGFLLCILALLVVLGVLGQPFFGRSQPKADAVVPPTFVVSNLVVGVVTNYIIYSTDGRLVFSVEPDLVSMRIRFREGVSVSLDRTNDSIRGIVLEKQSARSTERIIDLNADGIPDQKQISDSEDLLIFLKGEFIQSKREGTKRFVVLGGKKVQVSFDGSKWRAIEE